MHFLKSRCQELGVTNDVWAAAIKPLRAHWGANCGAEPALLWFTDTHSLFRRTMLRVRCLRGGSRGAEAAHLIGAMVGILVVSFLYKHLKKSLFFSGDGGGNKVCLSDVAPQGFQKLQFWLMFWFTACLMENQIHSNWLCGKKNKTLTLSNRAAGCRKWLVCNCWGSFFSFLRSSWPGSWVTVDSCWPQMHSQTQWHLSCLGASRGHTICGDSAPS